MKNTKKNFIGKAFCKLPQKYDHSKIETKLSSLK
jgi:hypothetical protein